MSYVTDKFDNEIVKSLKNGGVGLLPTDTIYGLSCRALDKTAVEKLHKLKDRHENKPFIILISDIKMLEQLSISRQQAKTAEPFWPGPLSVIFKSPAAPSWLQLGTSSLAVRLPDHPKLLNLIDAVGPLISTSANLETDEPARSMAEAQKIFGDSLDFYVDEGPLSNSASTLVAIKNGRLRVIRQGAVKID